MTGEGLHGELAGVFEGERPRLEAVARRVLGSPADAEDAVQEAWLRLARSDSSAIDNLRGWLTTVVARICLDKLRVRTSHPTTSFEDVLVVPDDGSTPPDQEVELAESVGLALLVVLERLSPTERLAFVLHDLFAVPFDEIAQVAGTSSGATKMAASRARRKVRGGTPGRENAAQRRAVVDAFLAAARGGDFAGLLTVLDPDVVLRADTPGGVVVVVGATEVAGRARTFAALAGATHEVLVDGLPGVVSQTTTGDPMSLMAFAVEGGRITAIACLADPPRLRRLDLPMVWGP
jgi:RNA polymerase sigma factor (sigma-70 family)